MEETGVYKRGEGHAPVQRWRTSTAPPAAAMPSSSQHTALGASEIGTSRQFASKTLCKESLLVSGLPKLCRFLETYFYLDNYLLSAQRCVKKQMNTCSTFTGVVVMG